MKTTNVEQGNNGFAVDKPPPQLKTRHHTCLIVVVCSLLFLLALFIVALILALTLFKPKEPRTEVISTTLEGVTPKVALSAFKLDLNITLHLNILVENPNYASFEHDAGQTVLVYQRYKIGDAELEPGLIAARSSSVLGCRLTLQVDRFLSGSRMMALVGDLTRGHVLLETHTEIPGKVKFLGIIAKHVMSTSDCQHVIGIPSLKVEKQHCSGNTKF